MAPSDAATCPNPSERKPSHEVRARCARAPAALRSPAPRRSGSIAGKKLVQKCKELQAENEQLGKDVSEGRMQQLRAEAAMHKVRWLRIEQNIIKYANAYEL